MAMPVPIGAWRSFWVGSAGPFWYDDGADVADPDLEYDGLAVPLQSGFTTNAQINIAQAPVEDYQALRLVDVGVIAGDVIGPAASTDNAVARWDGITGKLIDDSLLIVDNIGHISSFGGNIVFPAAQVSSAGANTLDDYQEGSWTPGLTFGGAAVGLVLAEAAGYYTKVGRVVTTTGSLRLTAKGTSVGSAVLTGFPFPTITGAPYSQPRAGGVIGEAANFTTITNIHFYMDHTASVAALIFDLGSVVTDAHFQNTSYLFGISITYLTN